MLRTVMNGIAGTDMAAWSDVLPKQQLEALGDYILSSLDTLPPKPEAKPDTIQTAD